MRKPTENQIEPSPIFRSCIRLVIGSLIGAFFILPISHAAEYQTQNVVLVIIDGLRYSEGLGDPDHTYVPEMWELAQEGAIVEPFLNDFLTYTSRAVPAIWCGAWTGVDEFADPDCGGDSNNSAHLPTVFEYYRKQLSRPEEDCIYFLKDVGCPWKASFDPDYGPDYWPLYHSEGWTDLDVWNEVGPMLNEHTPSFFMVYLASVDHEGHSGDWDAYVDAISVADGIVGMLWDSLQEHPYYAGTTTMFVTNDHGRHDYDFSGHGDSCDGCRTIQLLAVGPDIEPGLVSNIPRTIPDIVPTIGELLGFEAELATGDVMFEILQSGPSYSQWLDTVVHGDGQFNSRWRTDVSVRNMASSPANIEMRLYLNGAILSLFDTITPGAQGSFEDVVGLMASDGMGCLEVVSDQQLIVSGRTYNETAGGTLGQFVDAYRPEDTIGGGESAWLLQLRQESGRYRTNLSFANTSETPAGVQVRLFDATGVLLTQYSVTLAGHEMTQDLSPFSRRADRPNLGWGFAEVSLTSGNGLLASASVVDSVTNDATTIPFKKFENE